MGEEVIQADGAQFCRRYLSEALPTHIIETPFPKTSDMRNAAYEQLAVDDAKRREEMAVMSAKVAIVTTALLRPPLLARTTVAVRSSRLRDVADNDLTLLGARAYDRSRGSPSAARRRGRMAGASHGARQDAS
jgi:hypothetical protein